MLMYKGIVEVEFTIEQEEKLRECLEENWFEELNSKVNMYDEDAKTETKIGHIKKYIMHYCQSGFQATQEDVDNFFDLLSYYETKTYREPIRNKDGVIEIKKSGFNSGNAFYTRHVKPLIRCNAKGTFLDGILVTTDGKEYIKKLTMDSEGRLNGFTYREQARYNGTIAHEVFEFFGEKSANYLPAIYIAPAYYVLSENFLDQNQELINLSDFFQDKQEYNHSEILRLLEDNIRIRYKNNIGEEEYNKLINKLKMQYIRQAFLKKVIGLGDEKLENIGIVLTTNGDEMKVPDIDISPAFDLDMSFDLAEERKMRRIPTKNGQTDIKSFIEEFSHFDGFKEFMNMITRKIEEEETVIETILDKSYEVSKANYFIQEDARRNYKNYLRTRFRETKEAYQEIFIESERKEVKDDTEAILE